jgi:hypothetical protein
VVVNFFYRYIAARKIKHHASHSQLTNHENRWPPIKFPNPSIGLLPKEGQRLSCQNALQDTAVEAGGPTGGAKGGNWRETYPAVVGKGKHPKRRE